MLFQWSNKYFMIKFLHFIFDRSFVFHIGEYQYKINSLGSQFPYKNLLPIGKLFVALSDEYYKNIYL